MIRRRKEEILITIYFYHDFFFIARIALNGRKNIDRVFVTDVWHKLWRVPRMVLAYHLNSYFKFAIINCISHEVINKNFHNKKKKNFKKPIKRNFSKSKILLTQAFPNNFRIKKNDENSVYRKCSHSNADSIG